jgi:hypothetical protein
MSNARKHSLPNLHPSEVVTLAILFVIDEVGNRSFHRWMERDYRPLFSKILPMSMTEALFKTLLISTRSLWFCLREKVLDGEIKRCLTRSQYEQQNHRACSENIRAFA